MNTIYIYTICICTFTVNVRGQIYYSTRVLHGFLHAPIERKKPKNEYIYIHNMYADIYYIQVHTHAYVYDTRMCIQLIFRQTQAARIQTNI